MADLVFPSSPATGERFPVVPIANVPVWEWDSSKWRVKAGGSELHDGYIYGRRSDEWREIVPIVSELNGSVLDAKTAVAADVAIDLSGHCSFNAVLADPPAWSYLSNGAAATFHINPSLGSLQFLVATNGTSGNPITWTNWLDIHSNGNVETSGSVTANIEFNSPSIVDYSLRNIGRFQSAPGTFWCYIFQGNPNWYPITIFAYHVSGVAAGLHFMLHTSAEFVFRNLGEALKTGGAGPWSGPSDSRIKDIVSDYENGLLAIEQLNPVIYKFKGNDTIEPTFESQAPYPNSFHYGAATDAREYIGLVAQDCEEVMPELVKRTKGFIDGKPVDDLRELDTSPIVYTLVNAVKELSDKIDALEVSRG